MSSQIDSRSAAARTLLPVTTLMLAACCAFIVANHYYAQPLVGVIGAAFSMPPARFGWLVTAIQIGYGLGLVFVVPLGDLVENRRLVAASLCVAAAALLAMAGASRPPEWFAAAFVLGVATSALQVILPYAAQFTTEANRGRVIGRLTGGIMLGIMLARPVSSFITYYAGWRWVFAGSAVAVAFVALSLGAKMPAFAPRASSRYADILRSMPGLLYDLPVLRRRLAYHTALYASFSMFWVAVPLLLAGHRFGLTQRGIGLFAFAGAGGVVFAPLAGWIADRGWTRVATGTAILCILSAFTLAFTGAGLGSIGCLVASAILLDAGLVTNFVLSQRLIYGPRPESRSRIGGLFTAIFFTGGAAGSSIATAGFAAGGWGLICMIGFGLATLALCVWLTELRPHPAAAAG